MENKILTTTILLNNNIKIPVFGLGTYKLQPGQETYHSVLTALQMGYRHLDSAQYYNNEIDIAKAIKNSKVPRKEIFITSKIENKDHSYQNTLKQVDILLKKLDTNYFDLLLVHWPTSKWTECYQALIETLESKKTRAIGVSNFEIEHLKELQQKFIVLPAVNQIELHPGFNNQKVMQYCQEKNIVVESWGTMMRGACLQVPDIVALGNKYQKSPFQICLKWALQKNIVVFPKSAHPDNIRQNCQMDGWELSLSDMQILNDLPQKRIGPEPKEYVKHVKFNE